MEKIYQGGYGIGKPNSRTITWQAALVKGKCASTKTNSSCHKGFLIFNQYMTPIKLRTEQAYVFKSSTSTPQRGIELGTYCTTSEDLYQCARESESILLFSNSRYLLSCQSSSSWHVYSLWPYPCTQPQWIVELVQLLLQLVYPSIMLGFGGKISRNG